MALPMISDVKWHRYKVESSIYLHGPTFNPKIVCIFTVFTHPFCMGRLGAAATGSHRPCLKSTYYIERTV